MKQLFLAVSAAVVLTSCAGTKVTATHYASGALAPQKIFIRPFDTGTYSGDQGGEAMRAIVQSQGPTVFAEILKEELEKIAPTTVLQPGEEPDGGWLVTGDLEIVDGGSGVKRAFLGHLGAGRSQILVHVKVLDAERPGHRDAKGAASNVLYDFDVAGGSKLTGIAGSIMAPGLGLANSFDYRNAATRIGKVLNPDVEKYGMQASASIR